MWLGQTRYGTNLAPHAIRSAGLTERLQAVGRQVVDVGNIGIGITGRFQQQDMNIKNVKTVANASSKLADKVAAIVREKQFPLILGGDHSIAIGTLAGLAKEYRNLGVIWYDAHADMNTPDTSPSGNIHGMPLAVAMGLGHPALVKVGGAQPKVKPENIVLIGARDVDAGELALIAERNIRMYTAEEVNARGVEAVMREAVAYLAERCDGIHLSFDLDGLDPHVAPGVGTPVQAGLAWQESLQALAYLGACGKLTSAEFVEVNPLLDQGNRTAELAVELMAVLNGAPVKQVMPVRQTKRRAVQAATGS